jgi:ribosomal protein S18 acetylase RimI-like enzyme
MEQKIIYRKANPSDAIKLSVLFKTVYIQTYGKEGISDEFANFVVHQFSVERLQNVIEVSPDALIVAVYKENLVGVVQIDFDKKCPIDHIDAPELNKLYILDWFCGQGIGYQLLTEAVNTLKSKGYSEMWLWVLVTNERAISFYERQNFKWIGNAPFVMEKNSYDNKIMLKQF